MFMSVGMPVWWLRAENCLKKAKSLDDFFDQLQRLYPEIETDLSLRGELAKPEASAN